VADIISPEVSGIFDSCVPFFSAFTEPISFTLFNTDFSLGCVTWGVILAFIAVIVFVQKFDGIKDLLGVG